MSDFKSLFVVGANSDIAKSFVKKYHSMFQKITLGTSHPQQAASFAASVPHKDIQILPLDLCSDNISEQCMTGSVPDVLLITSGYHASEEEKDIEQIIAVNYAGIVKITEAILPEMRAKGQGTLIILSSAAGIRGKYSNRIYTASKAAISNYAEGLMSENERYGVKTVLFKLGHCNTKMLSEFKNRKPVFAAQPEDVSKQIRRAIKKQKSAIYYYRKSWRIISYLYRLIPLKAYIKLRY